MTNRIPFDDRVLRGPECWEWQGARSSAGYGQVWVDGKVVYAHRIAYERENGPLPTGHHALHHCDNPPCVRPSHLFAGTHAANMQDKALKGRAGNLLTAEQVAEIKRRHSAGESQQELADAFGCSRPNIGYIVRGVTWDWVVPS